MRGLLGVVLLAASSEAIWAAPPAPAPKSIAEIPLQKCIPAEVLGWIDYRSIQRAADAAPEGLRQTQKLQALMDKLPKSDRPVAELMTPAQSSQFSEISSQMRIHAYNDLAESRLQRDVLVMTWAADAIEKLRTNSPNLKTPDDPGADGAVLLGLLREAVKNDRDYALQPPGSGVCSLDLALYTKERERMEAAQTVIHSKEMYEWAALRLKYHVPEGAPLDPSKIPSPDQEKAVWLNAAAAKPLYLEMTAASDWENLRQFARVSDSEYTTFRDDILTGAGAKDYDFDTGIKKVYQSANSATQHVIDAWGVIDKNIPDEMTKSMKAFTDQNAKASPLPPR